jgi:streptogramin lyase
MTNRQAKKGIPRAFLTTVLVLYAIASITLYSPQPAFGVLPTSFTSTVFPAPGALGSHGVAIDSNGIVWWTPIGAQLIRQDPSFTPGDPAGFTIIATPHPALNMAIDNQDNVWISNFDGVVTKYDPMANSFTNFGPIGVCFILDHIHIHNDGKVYTTCLDGGFIIRLDPATGTVDTFPTPTSASTTSGITGDFTGILWSIERTADNVVHANPALMAPGTSAGMTEFAIPTPPSNPETVKACGDRIWFTQLSGFGPVQLGVMNRVTNVITEFDLDPGASGGSYGLAVDGSGNPWMTNPSNPKIYGYDITTNTVTTFSTPTTPHHLAISPSGEIWYTDLESFAPKIVRLTPDVPLAPACIPTAPPTKLTLTPATASNPAGGAHTVTATVSRNGTPVPGITVSFTVSGANTASGSCVTDTSGECAFTYSASNAGTDTITATASVDEFELAATASKTWEAIGPPSEAKTIGFWKNHPADTAALLPQTLGTYLVDTFPKARAVFDAADAQNAHNMLAAQLLAAKLNKTNGVPSSCVDTALSDADGILSAAGYAGPDTTAPPHKAAKNGVNAIKDKLDNFNQHGC